MATTREVMRQEVPRLRRFAYSLTGNAADADDLVHDVVVKALEKGLPAGDPVPWLLTLTKNLWIDRLRQREVRGRPQNEQDVPVPAMEAELSTQLHAERVLMKMQQLPEQLRLTLVLVAIDGMSYREAAAVLDVPLGTVMSRIARARVQLLDLLGSREAKS